MKPYKRDNIPLARKLRKEMTPWERKLWYEFLRMYPVRFQRQKAIGPYIVDFYCAKTRLVIELDGGGHYEREQMERDEQRTRALEEMSLKVIRICNLDIDGNFFGVCQMIDERVRKDYPSVTFGDSSPYTHPPAGGRTERNRAQPGSWRGGRGADSLPLTREVPRRGGGRDTTRFSPEKALRNRWLRKFQGDLIDFFLWFLLH